MFFYDFISLSNRKDPEELYADYIEGKRSYFDVSLEVRKR